jgi:hypothetical protein
MIERRRILLASSAALFGLSSMLVCARAALSEPDVKGIAPSGFEFKELDDKSLGLFESERPVLVYRFGKMSLPGVRMAGTRSSYVHPIYGLDGETLTDDFPADHYHHHGLFWGWPHVKIGDREYDLWKMRGIRIDFARWLAKEAGMDHAKLGVENGWFVRDKCVVKEELWLDIHPGGKEGRNLDVRLTWTATDKAVTLGGAEGKSYGGLTLRFAPRKNTLITTPDGRAKEDLLITRLPWADLSATFDGARGPSGAAIFVHPRHPQYPPEWMTRDYGVLAVGWPGVKAETMEPGKAVTCQYRVWIHRGAPDAAEIAKQYDAYVREANRRTAK